MKKAWAGGGEDFPPQQTIHTEIRIEDNWQNNLYKDMRDNLGPIVTCSLLIVILGYVLWKKFK